MLENVIRANIEYQSEVESHIHRALEDEAYQKDLWRHWHGYEATIGEAELPTGVRMPATALPEIVHPSQIAWFMGEWGLPGEFPYGLSLYPRQYLLMDQFEEPTRMFAGLGSPEMTNERFKLLAGNQRSRRLSTAFDTMTLLGRDADDSDYLFDVGEGGVSVSTYEDIVKLFDGFLGEDVSISMTINGPALWMTAARIRASEESGADLSAIRGTSQTDPLKEDDAQNELVFPLDKSHRIALDMFEWCAERVPKYYPINVSGYHINQKGATPTQMVAITLANLFKYIDDACARGMDINTAAQRLPIFITSGVDLEYIATLSAARRIFAVAMRDAYGATDPRAQKLKAHIQTDGRSLQSRRILNNITRTTLQSFYAALNYAQSMHSNSYDEPVTTPTERTVRVASDSQAILLEELGGFKDMMSFLSDSSGRYAVYKKNISEVLSIFSELSEYSDVMEAKADGFFRDLITTSSNAYERQKHSGERRIVGVNVYTNGTEEQDGMERVHIPRSLKRGRAREVRAFKKRRDPAAVSRALTELTQTAQSGGNVFEATYKHVKTLTIGEWTNALQRVYGIYRRKL